MRLNSGSALDVRAARHHHVVAPSTTSTFYCFDPSSGMIAP
jgi:hypothetical protein